MDTSHRAANYYYISLTPRATRRLFRSNNDRAFVLLQLQQLLSMRSILDDHFSRHSLAVYIDLLAYSLHPAKASFVIYALTEEAAQQFSAIILHRLTHYLRGPSPHSHDQLQLTITLLRGVHDALAHTKQLHLAHEDWEYDRYSSICFYLHDRRGDWMRIWRLTRLYDNQPDLYRTFLTSPTYSSLHES